MMRFGIFNCDKIERLCEMIVQQQYSLSQVQHQILKTQTLLLYRISALEKKGDIMAKTLQDVDSAIAANQDLEANTLTALAAQLKASTEALLAKIAAGAPPTDYQAEVDALNALHDGLQAVAQSLTDTQTEANPPA